MPGVYWLRNAKALHSAFEVAVAPHQLWSQKLEASAFDWEFQKMKLFSKLKGMNESSLLPDKQHKFMEKIE